DEAARLSRAAAVARTTHRGGRRRFPMYAIDKLPNLKALIGDRILRLAVTGLTRSGKTVLVASLVQNLLTAVRAPGSLPFLRAAAERRIIGAQLLPPEGGDVPEFPLDATIGALAADPPQWPASTTDLRRLRLSLRFLPTGLLGRIHRLGGTARVTLE